MKKQKQNIFKKYGKKLGVLALASVLVVSVLSGCGSSGSGSASESTEEADSIKIGTMDLVNADLVARAENYYEEELGVDVDIVKFDSGADVNTALAAGSIDVSELGSNPTALGISNDLGYDVIYIGDIIGSAESLVAKNGSGITSVKDLVGKKVATPFASTSHFSLLNALKKEGISENEVDLLDMQPDDIYAAWQRGDLDAAYVWYPVLDELLADGTIITGSDKLAEDGVVTADLVVAREAFASANPDLVTKFIKALNRGNQLLLDDPDQVTKDVADQLGISEEDAASQIEGFEWVQGEDQLKEEYLGGNIAQILKDTSDFLKEQGSIQESADLETYQDHVKTSYLEDALKDE